MDLIIRQSEGCELQAYWDKIGKCWTIGYGITQYPNGEKVKEGDTITKEYAEALLTDYLMKNVVPHLAKIPYAITLDQKRALCSLIYNIGWTRVSKSKLWQAILKKDYKNIFLEWNWGISQAKGLAKRRAYELYYYMKDI